jgi:hypothetical protein
MVSRGACARAASSFNVGILATDLSESEQLSPKRSRCLGGSRCLGRALYLVEVAELGARLATTLECETITIAASLDGISGRQLISGDWNRELDHSGSSGTPGIVGLRRGRTAADVALRAHRAVLGAVQRRLQAAPDPVLPALHRRRWTACARRCVRNGTAPAPVPERGTRRRRLRRVGRHDRRLPREGRARAPLAEPVLAANARARPPASLPDHLRLRGVRPREHPHRTRRRSAGSAPTSRRGERCSSTSKCPTPTPGSGRCGRRRPAPRCPRSPKRRS